MKHILLLLISLLFTGCLFDSQDEQTHTDLHVPSTPTQTNPIVGSVPTLFVLVNFANTQYIHPDVTIGTETIPAAWARKSFGTQFGELNHYWLSNFGGEFKTIPIPHTGEGVPGVIVVNLPTTNHPGDLVAKTETPTGYSMNLLLKEILTKVDPFVDFSIYDTDKDGFISRGEAGIVFIFGGFDAAYGNPDTMLLSSVSPDDGTHFIPSKSIWPHAFTNYNDPSAPSTVRKIINPKLDGVQLFDYLHDGKYAVFAQRQDNHHTTVGIFAHEMGHSVFALPDLYDTVDSSDTGIGYMDLMGTGNWGTSTDDLAALRYKGSTPVPMSAFTKSLSLGHLNNKIIIPVNNNVKSTVWTHTIPITNITRTSSAILIPTLNPNVRYVVELMESNGYWAGLNDFFKPFIPFDGLSIKRLDSSQPTNNDESNRLIETIIPNPTSINVYDRMLLTTSDSATPYIIKEAGVDVGTLSNFTFDSRGFVFTFTEATVPSK